MSSVPASVPVRTCVGCRQRSPVSVLLRVVVVGSASGLRLLPDPRRRRAGRGASVHLDPACLDLAERRRAFGRALRVPGVPDATELRVHIASHARSGSTSSGRGTSPVRTTPRQVEKQMSQR